MTYRVRKKATKNKGTQGIKQECKEKEGRINRRSKTCYKHKILSFSSVETLPKYVEILCWNLCFENKRRGGRGGITALSISLWDHNDDKESITVLL